MKLTLLNYFDLSNTYMVVYMPTDAISYGTHNLTIIPPWGIWDKPGLCL